MSLTDSLLSGLVALLGFALLQGQLVYRRAAAVHQALVGYDGKGGVIGDVSELKQTRLELTQAVTALQDGVGELRNWRAALERDGVFNRRQRKIREG